MPFLALYVILVGLIRYAAHNKIMLHFNHSSIDSASIILFRFCKSKSSK